MPKASLAFPSDVIWFPSEIRRLLKAIEQHPGLYDPRNEAFGIREKNNVMWGAVAKLVGGKKTDIQCRDKWTCLRGTYRRHVRTELANSVRRRSNWPWVEEMNFMRNFILDREEMAEMQLLAKKNKMLNPNKNQASESESKNQDQAKTSAVNQHQPNCPQGKVVVTTSNAAVSSASGKVTFPGNIYSGGIIYKGVGLGLMQPNIMVQQNATTKGVRMSLVQQGQPNMRIVQPSQSCIVQPNQTLGLIRTNQPTLRIVHTTQGSSGVAIVQPNIAVTSTSENTNVSNTVTTKPTETASSDPIQVDLSKVKQDPDTLDNTEFIDMNTMIKKEPMDIEGDDETNDQFNFLPEDTNGVPGIASVDEGDQSSQDESHKPDSDRSNQSTPKSQVSPKSAEDSVNDSNQLFMSSVLANMRKLSPYDQSMFRLKVLQILHEMMFPKK